MPELQFKGEHGTYIYSDVGQFQLWRQDENTKKHPLLSPRDSEREAKRLLGNFRLRQGYLAIVFGAGALPLLKKLREQQKQYGGDVLIVEADAPLAKEFTNRYRDEYTTAAFLTPHNPDELTHYAENMQVEQLAGYRIFAPTGLVSVAPAFYRQMEYDIKQLFASRLSDLFTRMEFEPRWVFNALSNLPYLLRARPAKKLFSTMAGSTAIIVSTGPSLRLSLKWLHAMQHRAFIACADSAWRVLHDSGITPHLIFSLDSQAHTLRHIAGMPSGGPNSFPVLYADLVANPQVVRRWKGPLFFGVTAHFSGERRTITPGCDFIESEFLNNTSLGDVQSGGSVATSIFDFLRQMNFSQIIFTGQDLAYTWREIHTMGTHHSKQWFSRDTWRLNPIENINETILHRRHVKNEISMTGSAIPADYVLSLYRNWFNEAISKVPQQVLNFSADGLALEGAKRPNDFLTTVVGSSDFLAERHLRHILNIPMLGSDAALYKKLSRFYDKLEQNDQIDMTFLKYAGRKFDIRAKRTNDEDKAQAFREKSTESIRIFLRHLQRYIPLWRRELDNLKATFE